MSTAALNLGVLIGEKGDITNVLHQSNQFVKERKALTKAIGDILGQKTKFTPDLLDKWLGVGKKNVTLDAMGDYYRALESRVNTTVNNITTNVNINNRTTNITNNYYSITKSKLKSILAFLKGKDGKDGINGKDGKDGINGKDADMK